MNQNKGQQGELIVLGVLNDACLSLGGIEPLRHSRTNTPDMGVDIVLTGNKTSMEAIIAVAQGTTTEPSTSAAQPDNTLTTEPSTSAAQQDNTQTTEPSTSAAQQDNTQTAEPSISAAQPDNTQTKARIDVKNYEGKITKAAVDKFISEVSILPSYEYHLIVGSNGMMSKAQLAFDAAKLALAERGKKLHYINNQGVYNLSQAFPPIRQVNPQELKAEISPQGNKKKT